MLLIAQMFVHLRFQQLLQRVGKQVFQGILGVLSCHYVVLLDEHSKLFLTPHSHVFPHLSLIPILLGLGIYTIYFTDSISHSNQPIDKL